MSAGTAATEAAVRATRTPFVPPARAGASPRSPGVNGAG